MMTIIEIPYQYVSRLNHLNPNSIQISYGLYKKIKRALDLIVCIAAIPFLAIPVILISLAIVIDSPGSPIFAQERAGYRGRKFQFYKFRTLWNNYDDQENRKFMQSFIKGNLIIDGDGDRVAKYKPLQSNDVTRIGKFLRKTSLDEIPQLINVIRGDMTLIGPRPNVLWEVDAYKEWHRERLFVQPGMTGLAQVFGRSDLSFDDIVRYDIQYGKNQSINLDMWILRRTIKVIFKRNGAG
jgi:undecaprenyl-phosphate galactose phosphotransferase